MSNETKNRKKRLILLYLSIFLVVAIALTAVIVFMNMPKNELSDAEVDVSIDSGDDSTGGNSSSGSENENGDKTDPVDTRAPKLSIDGRDAAGNITADLNLFTTHYFGENSEITVAASDGEKIIAPGTRRIYNLRIKNIGDAAMDYTLKASPYYTDNLKDRETPLLIRISHASGGYLVGTSTTMVPLKEMNFPITNGVLGAGCYDEYAIEWEWPFEEGETETEIENNDISDTFLGTLAAKEPVRMGLTFDVEAEADPNPDAQGGTKLPQTGDSENYSLWLAIAIAAAIIMLLIIISRSFFEDESNEAQNA